MKCLLKPFSYWARFFWKYHFSTEKLLQIFSILTSLSKEGRRLSIAHYRRYCVQSLYVERMVAIENKFNVFLNFCKLKNNEICVLFSIYYVNWRMCFHLVKAKTELIVYSICSFILQNYAILLNEISHLFHELNCNVYPISAIFYLWLSCVMT